MASTEIRGIEIAERRSQLIRRRAWVVGVIVVVIATVTLVVARVRFGSGFLIENDAGIYLRIARDPFGHGASLAGLPPGSGSAYRFGRILYPLMAWVLAGGRPAIVSWTLPIVYVLGLGLLGAVASELAARRGVTPEWGLIVFACPAFWLTFPVLFPDAFVTALILLTFLFWLDGRTAQSKVVAALTLLAREISLIAMVPLVFADIRRKGIREAAPWVLVVVPLIAWWTWVRARFGIWPVTDPSYARRGALGGPLVGVIRTIHEGKLSRPLYVFALVLLAVTVAAALWIWRRRPWAPFSGAALLLSMLLLFLGPSAMRLPGAAIRLMLPAQVLVALSLIRSRRSTQLSENGP